MKAVCSNPVMVAKRAPGHKALALFQHSPAGMVSTPLVGVWQLAPMYPWAQLHPQEEVSTPSVWPVAVLLCWQALPSAPWVQGANWQIEPVYPLMQVQAQLPAYPEMAPPCWHGEPPEPPTPENHKIEKKR
jgi:hypothetical protein